MTVIDFYPGFDQPVSVAVRLVAKAYAQYGNVRVLTADPAMTEELDRRLWTEVPMSFLPHCRTDSELAAVTPILIGHQPTHDAPCAVLVNLSNEVPAFFSRFERLAELIGTDKPAIERGRERYAFYKQRGYELRVNRPPGKR